MTTPGGNSPQMLVNEAALEIQRGELDLAILAGGEAWRTRMRARKAGATLTWPKLPEDAPPARVIGHELAMSSPDEMARGIVMPVQVYPMFETAVRAAAGSGRRRAPGRGQRAVVPLLGRRRRQPLRVEPAGARRQRRSAPPARPTA